MQICNNSKNYIISYLFLTIQEMDQLARSLELNSSSYRLGISQVEPFNSLEVLDLISISI